MAYETEKFLYSGREILLATGSPDLIYNLIITGSCSTTTPRDYGYDQAPGALSFSEKHSKLIKKIEDSVKKWFKENDTQWFESLVKSRDSYMNPNRDLAETIIFVLTCLPHPDALIFAMDTSEGKLYLVTTNKDFQFPFFHYAISGEIIYFVHSEDPRIKMRSTIFGRSKLKITPLPSMIHTFNLRTMQWDSEIDIVPNPTGPSSCPVIFAYDGNLYSFSFDKDLQQPYFEFLNTKTKTKTWEKIENPNSLPLYMKTLSYAGPTPIIDKRFNLFLKFGCDHNPVETLFNLKSHQWDEKGLLSYPSSPSILCGDWSPKRVRGCIVDKFFFIFRINVRIPYKASNVVHDMNDMDGDGPFQVISLTSLIDNRPFDHSEFFLNHITGLGFCLVIFFTIQHNKAVMSLTFDLAKDDKFKLCQLVKKSVFYLPSYLRSHHEPDYCIKLENSEPKDC